jgi:hypothetical protein
VTLFLALSRPADVPVDLRPDAVQCILLLLPDEHREALETLLDFLNHVASNSPYNQMTASNLAVCLAPSLFHFNHSNANVSSNRSNSVSPRRRKTVGIPDQRELSENKAAHDCLLYLIKTHRELFMVRPDRERKRVRTMRKCCAEPSIFALISFAKTGERFLSLLLFRIPGVGTMGLGRRGKNELRFLSVIILSIGIVLFHFMLHVYFRQLSHDLPDFLTILTTTATSTFNCLLIHYFTHRKESTYLLSILG